jgi:hypothetical protein
VLAGIEVRQAAERRNGRPASIHVGLWLQHADRKPLPAASCYPRPV